MYKKILLFSSIVLLSACSSKEYYTPEQTVSITTHSMGDKLTHYSRDGATLESGKILTKKEALNLKLGKGFYFINETQGIAITADLQGRCNLLTKKGVKSSIKFTEPLISATLIGKQLVFLLQNNSFGIYDLEKKSITYTAKAEKSYTIDRRIANPLPVDRLVVIPTLDGKLVILDLSTLKIVKEMYVSTESTLNNVIFLQKLNNTLIAATPYKVLSVSSKGKKELETGISEVILDKKNIFIFTKDGRILKTDENLAINSEKKFKFAHFSVATSNNNKIYALDKQGYLIVLNKNLSKHRVYKITAVTDYAFVSGETLYYNDETVNLSALN